MAKRKVSSNGTTAAEAAAVQEVQMGEQTETTSEQTTTEPVVRTCLCGCGSPVRGRRANFAPGHDSRLKSRLLLAARAGNAEARADLIKMGWATNESIDRVAASSRLTEEQRRERERERLTAKLERARQEVARLEAELAALA